MTDLSALAKRSTANGDTRSGLRLRLRFAVLVGQPTPIRPSTSPAASSTQDHWFFTRRLALDPSLLYPTRDEAVLEGMAVCDWRKAVRRISHAVGELAAQLPVSRPGVSEHLRILKDAGLVIDEALGAKRVYRPDPATLADLRRYFDGFWADALAQYATFAAAQTKRVDVDR